MTARAILAAKLASHRAARAQRKAELKAEFRPKYDVRPDITLLTWEDERAALAFAIGELLIEHRRFDMLTFERSLGILGDLDRFTALMDEKWPGFAFHVTLAERLANPDRRANR